jgi:hypothetical protein
VASSFVTAAFAVLKHIALDLIRLGPIPHKGGIEARRLIAARSDQYREQPFGAGDEGSCDCFWVPPDAMCRIKPNSI